MSIVQTHIHTAELLLADYDGKLPFPEYARQYFREHKKHGSRDRRSILGFCYAYFRMGFSLQQESILNNILAGLFLMNAVADSALTTLDPEWAENIERPLREKLIKVKERFADFNPRQIFPYSDLISEGIESDAFVTSHLQQPSLFVRIRPGNHQKIQERLDKLLVHYEILSPDTIRLPNGFDLNSISSTDLELVVQDLSSQRVSELLVEVISGQKSFEIWDCCAGSGGKSLMLYDRFPGCRLSVSDIRTSILINLERRFQSAGLQSQNILVADLEKRNVPEYRGRFDLVIADVPCTGSGTWGRNPEWLRFFDTKRMDHQVKRQLSIAHHAAEGVKPGGYFLYITCSVFRQENEEQAEALQALTGLRLMKSSVLKGYAETADTMYAALFTLPA